MKAVVLLIASLAVGSAWASKSRATTEPFDGISLTEAPAPHAASLLSGQSLQGFGSWAMDRALRIGEAMSGTLPLTADDFYDGAGMGSAARDGQRVLGLVIGLVVGFGLGQLIVGDIAGFVVFLIVDVAIIVVATVLNFAILGFWWGYLALVVSHVIQGIDAFNYGPGEPLTQLNRDLAVPIASSPGTEGPGLTTARLARFAF